MLVPSVKPTRRMVLNKGTYAFALNVDGSCCFVILMDQATADAAMFPPTPTDTTTVIGAAENAGDITTKDISIFLFYNVLQIDSNGFLFTGYHAWDFEPADTKIGKDKYYVMAWVNWIDTIQDVSTLSHELAEIVNDPFPSIDAAFDVDEIHNITPWFLAPNGFCADRIEVGDGIELLPNSAYPVTMNEMIYHLQNITLIPWFKREAPSSALHNAYSFPNENVITALSPPQRVNCQ